MPRAKALVVDADPAVRNIVRSVLEARSVDLSETITRDDAEHRLRERAYDVLLIDVDDPGLAGLGGAPDRLPVTLGLGGSSPGGEKIPFDRLDKPLQRESLEQALERALSLAAALSEVRRLRTLLRAGEMQLVGASAALEKLRADLDRAASATTPLWLYGETGTGKALAARLMHDRSHRSAQAFVSVHASTVTTADWPELLRQAEDGTLFLEDAGNLSQEAQERIVAKPPSRTRLVMASLDDPRLLEERGDLLPGFRRRMAGDPLQMPPLRDRAEDIPLLARHFVQSVADLNRMGPVRLSGEALDQLVSHHWPGNVQELRNAMEHAVILAPDGQIRIQDLPDSVQSGPRSAPGHGHDEDLAARPFREVKSEVVSDFESRYLTQLLERFSGNVTVAARHSGMLRSALQRLLRKHGLRSSEFRRRGAVARKEVRAGSGLRAD